MSKRVRGTQREGRRGEEEIKLVDKKGESGIKRMRKKKGKK